MLVRPWWEVVLFLALAGLSAAGFWVRFRRVFWTIAGSKKDADFL